MRGRGRGEVASVSSESSSPRVSLSARDEASGRVGVRRGASVGARVCACLRVLAGRGGGGGRRRWE
jgi:hypothetical protein